MLAEIAIDARIGNTGLGTYTHNLIVGLAVYSTDFAIRAIVHQHNADRVAAVCGRVAVVNTPIYSVREQMEIPRAASGCALLHVPHYNVPLLYMGCLLVSIHDLIHIMEPAFRRSLASWCYARPMLKLSARKAAHVITVSQYSKVQIVERLGIAPSKVSVIYNGVAAQFHSRDRQECATRISEALSLHTPYLLYVGNLKPHKNVIGLLRALALLRQRRQAALQLLVVGEDATWKPALRRECARVGLEDTVRFIPQVSDDLLPVVYAAAELLVQPSTLEGFGLPVLEAMACGTPVVCSNAASLPEVGGNAAEYFDPYSVEDMAAAIRRVLSSSSRREELRQKGLLQASRFRWDECVRQHAEVYRRLLAMN
jgi:glycosyltransferase involved in cell wall biosynthesis